MDSDDGFKPRVGYEWPLLRACEERIKEVEVGGFASDTSASVAAARLVPERSVIRCAMIDRVQNKAGRSKRLQGAILGQRTEL